jgi:hypothetical protein
MTVPTRTQPLKNIWVAAGDGDLNRVQVSLLVLSTLVTRQARSNLCTEETRL